MRASIRIAVLVVCLFFLGLFALRLRSLGRPATVPVVITKSAQATTYTFESFRLDVPPNEDVVECRSFHGEDRLHVVSSHNGSMELAVRGIHGPNSDEEDREWQVDNFGYNQKPPFRRTETVFDGKPAVQLSALGDFVAEFGRQDGQIHDLEERITVVAWRGHILGIVTSFNRGDSKASSEADRLIAHLKLRDTD